ncbi:MAG: tyrosine-protein phosphatase [Armatimonadota bacterium]
MIDIHSHILPEIDDGPATLADALLMAELAVAGGNSVVFATPHLAGRQDLEKAKELTGHTARLQDALTGAGIPLRLLPGMEVYPEEFILDAVAAGYPITLGQGGKYLLLETPPTRLPMGFEHLVYGLELKGITAILAHPERSAAVQENPQVLEPLVERGVLLQINAGSLLGRNGPRAEQTACTLLRLHWVQFVASDAHSPRRRRPGLTQVMPRLTEIVGQEMAAALVKHHGQCVIDGQPISSAPRAYPAARKGWRLFGWFARACRS